MATFVELKGERSRKERDNTRVSLNIVNTEGNGKRIKLSKGLLEFIGNPSSVQVSVSDTALKIGASLKNCQVDFQLTGRNDTIYKAGLVDELTEHFGLDFSKKSSLTFDDVEIKQRRCNGEAIPYALIRFVSEEEESNDEVTCNSRW